MRVFILEYICGGGMAGRPLPESLAREGWAMLASIVEDFSRVEGCEVVTTLDERFVGRPLAARWIERVVSPGEQTTNDRERRLIERLAGECDWTLVIAPEFDGISFDRVHWVEEAGGRLLGPSSSAIAATADKFHCGQLLQRAGVPTVVGQVVLVDELPARASESRFPAVLKPRNGAGSQATFLVRDAASLAGVARAAHAEGLDGECLLQPFVAGLAASASFLVGPAGPMPLLAGEQLLSDDGRFRYLGGRMPLEPEYSSHAIELGRHAVAAVPGLCGYVGVDLVLEAKPLKSQISDCKSQMPDDTCKGRDTIIEINPRLTTSYVGLRALCEDNLAERLLAVCEDRELPPIRWKPEAICFRWDSTLT